jgi:hypothetical protein
MRLTEKQIFVAINALRIAAARYLEDAKAMRAQGGNYAGLVPQFERQEADARALADYMEEQESVNAGLDLPEWALPLSRTELIARIVTLEAQIEALEDELIEQGIQHDMDTDCGVQS